MFKIGRVLQFYTKTSIAIVELDGTLAIGDRIKFERDGQNLFEMIIESIQIEYNKVAVAHRGNVIGLKTNEEVEKNDEIFKI